MQQLLYPEAHVTREVVNSLASLGCTFLAYRSGIFGSSKASVRTHKTKAEAVWTA
jgi:hypothetical protein